MIERDEALVASWRRGDLLLRELIPLLRRNGRTMAEIEALIKQRPRPSVGLSYRIVPREVPRKSEALYIGKPR